MSFGRPKTYKYPPLVRIDVGIDCCFTVKEKRNIFEALIKWQDATDGLVIFHIGNMSMNKLIMDSDDDGYTWYSINIIKSYHTDKAIVDFESKDGYKISGLAVWHKDTTMALIVVDRIIDKSKKCFISLVMHEIGHLLGLGHDVRNTLMYKYGGRAAKVTKADRHKLIDCWRKGLLKVH